MKTYHGTMRDRHQGEVHVREGGQYQGPLDPRYDLANHSPTGFSWGYMGSGPSQLALALLADAISAEAAQEFYQDFKAQVIAPLDQRKPWILTEAQVREAARHVGWSG